MKNTIKNMKTQKIRHIKTKKAAPKGNNYSENQLNYLISCYNPTMTIEEGMDFDESHKPSWEVISNFIL